MVSFRKKKSDRKSLLKPKKLFGKKQERSDSVEKGGIGKIFKKKDDDDDLTPPVTPEVKAPLNVTVVTSHETPPEPQEDEGSFPDTISDLSASIIPSLPHKLPPPVTPEERAAALGDDPTYTKAPSSGGTFSTHRGNQNEGREDDGDSGFGFMTIMDNACSIPTNWVKGSSSIDTAGGQGVEETAPSWGVAPTREEDEEDEEDAREKEEEETATETNAAETVGAETVQEGYELVLDAPPQTQEPKRKNRVWGRTKKSVTVEYEPETEHEFVGAEKPSFMKKRFSQPRSLRPKQEESLFVPDEEETYETDQKPQMISLAEEVLNPEDLLDDNLIMEEDSETEWRSESLATSLGDVLDTSKASLEESATKLPATPEGPVEEEEPAPKSPTPVTSETRSRSWGIQSLTKSINGLKSKKDADDGRKDAKSPSLSSFINIMGGSPDKKSRDKPRPENPPKKEKPVWKAAVDPNTGLTYYYHRITRSTTWTKPPDFDKGRAPPKKDLDISAERQKKIDEGVEVPVSNEVLSILQKQGSMRSQHSAKFTKKQMQIKHLLLAMSPPDTASVEKIIEEYRGREDELLEQLHEIVDSQPFDEPIKTAEDSPIEYEPDDGNTMGEETETSSGLRLPPAPGFKSRVATGHTNLTGHSNKTRKAGNTRRGLNISTQSSEKYDPLSLGAATPINEGDQGEETSDLLRETASKSEATPVNVPTKHELPSKKVKAPRLRELLVEEYGSGRYGLKTEKYNGQAIHARDSRRAMKDSSRRNIDNKDEKTSQPAEGESFATDSVSGLSSSDAGFGIRKDQFEMAARSALGDAIRNQDWDLAATVTEEMRTESYPVQLDDTEGGEWTQSSLDKFISDSDWDAVAKYIASMRDRNAGAEQDPEVAHPPSNYSSLAGPGPARKKFGARSQLQHNDLNSTTSFGSADSFGSGFYSSPSTASAHDNGPPQSGERTSRDNRKEFAC